MAQPVGVKVFRSLKSRCEKKAAEAAFDVICAKGSGGTLGVLLTEALDTASGVDDLLFAGIERMAG